VKYVMKYVVTHNIPRIVLMSYADNTSVKYVMKYVVTHNIPRIVLMSYADN